MAFLGSGGQSRGAWAFVQAWPLLAWIVRPLPLAVLVALGACADRHTIGPEAWWHDAIGGKIAEERPPPPGDKDAFPNLATVPPSPAKADAAAWNRMTTGLITDRINANQAAALAPIVVQPPLAPVPGQVSATPPEAGISAALEGASTAPANGPKPSNAVSPAAPRPTGAPPGPSRPAAAPVSPTASPAGTPAGTSGGKATPPANPSVIAQVPVESPALAAARVANGPLPPLPTEEPPRPGIAPAPPARAVPITATPPSATPAPPDGTGIDFPPRSAALNDAALADVRTLAAARGKHGIAVTGYGDAATSDPIDQSRALDLGLQRAQALAGALVAQGVPYAALRLNAEAAGRGASLRLLR
jgi:outer membrane protein OmpA-like peptidoglycan-associated protein